MTPEDFKARVIDTCRGAFTSGKRENSVVDAVGKIVKWVRKARGDQEDHYRVLRDLVEDARRGSDWVYHAMMIAVHDSLLRREAFGARHSRIFDEQFYLGMHDDVAKAVGDGTFADGFHHFAKFGWSEGRMAYSWRSADAPTRTPTPTPTPTTRKRQAFGINMIGYHSANLGLGVSTRAYRRFLLDAGVEICPVEIPTPDRRSGHDTTYADEFWPLDTPAPYPVNMFVMSPGNIANLIGRRHPAVRAEGRINAVLLFWELARLPRPWVTVLNEMDILIAPSGFIKYAALMDLDGPIVRDFDHPLYIDADVKPDRRRWEIPDDTVAFVSSFEMASDINRKNPFAGISAFVKALGGNDKAMLIIKVNNAKSSPDYAPHLDRLADLADRNPNIRLLDDVLGYSDVMSLFASCDVLVSLHHSEGLGLCLMEAMTLGKPVIATAWSGNMAFTTEQNSCLVGYDLVPVRHATQETYSSMNIREDACWAEARIDEAAWWMQRLVNEPELRERIGRRAAADMVEYQKRIDAGELVASIQNLAERRGMSLA